LARDIISKIKTKIAFCCSEFGKRGSILLEVAIATAIIGVISSFLIAKTIVANKIARTQLTKNNIETTAVALASFVANYNRLPRPSFDAEGRESADLGMDSSNFVGRVPFYALGIPAKTALDGDGKPLVYIVEPILTSDFPRIYEKGLDHFFCEDFSPKIFVDRIAVSSCNPVAFVLDTRDNPPSVSEDIRITVSKNTFWILRDELLMRYLKNAPCRREVPVEPQIENGSSAAI
jgi:hypothetical protein